MRPSPAFVIAALAACAEPAPTTLPDDPVNRCSPAGSGLDIGGFAGNAGDAEATPVRRLVLMGGGPEDDAAA